MQRVGITVIGCGGGFYHLLPSFVNTLHCMEREGWEPQVRLVDPDTIEEHNKYRQWDDGGVPGMSKVGQAWHIGNEMGDGRQIPWAPIQGRAREHHMDWSGVKDQVDAGIVLVLPDNHLCRAQVHRSLWEMKLPYPVVEITAGNTKEDGWADGCIFQDGKIVNDWGPRHLSVFIEAREEMKPKTTEVVETCVVNPEGYVNQTIEANMLTARLVIGVLSGMWFGGLRPGKFEWFNTEADGIALREWWNEMIIETTRVEDYMQGIPRLER